MIQIKTTLDEVTKLKDFSVPWWLLNVFVVFLSPGSKMHTNLPTVWGPMPPLSPRFLSVPLQLSRYTLMAIRKTQKALCDFGVGMEATGYVESFGRALVTQNSNKTTLRKIKKNKMGTSNFILFICCLKTVITLIKDHSRDKVKFENRTG